MVKGNSKRSKIFVYHIAINLPVKRTNAVAPFLDIPPHTCILRGCFGFAFSFLGSPFL